MPTRPTTAPACVRSCADDAESRRFPQLHATARRRIAGFEAMLWLRKGFGFAGRWTVRRQNELLGQRSGLQMVNNAQS